METMQIPSKIKNKAHTIHLELYRVKNKIDLKMIVRSSLHSCIFN